MAPPIIRKVKGYSDPGKTMIIDVPSGTTCPFLEAVRGSDFCPLVTDPTPFGLHDMSLVVEVTRKLSMPCGVVLNRAGVDNNKVEEYCSAVGLPILLRIPLDIEIARRYSQGITLIEGMPQRLPSFRTLFQYIFQIVSGHYATRNSR
jgi:MinD superfamily P-loop ATPase